MVDVSHTPMALSDRILVRCPYSQEVLTKLLRTPEYSCGDKLTPGQVPSTERVTRTHCILRLASVRRTSQAIRRKDVPISSTGLVIHQAIASLVLGVKGMLQSKD